MEPEPRNPDPSATSKGGTMMRAPSSNSPSVASGCARATETVAGQAGPTLAPSDPVQLHLEGKARGFRNTLSFRRFCVREGVEIIRRGRLQFVRPCDVTRAITGERAPSTIIARLAGGMK